MFKFKLSSFFLSVLGFAFLFQSCNEDDSSVNQGTVINFTTSNFTNDSLALIIANVNDKFIETPITIQFAEGEYTLSQAFGFIGTEGLHIKGAGRLLTTLNFDFNVRNGFPIDGGSNVTLCDFTAKNTITSIFEIRNVNKLLFSNVGAIWDTQSSQSGPYGFYPTASKNVVIENCYAKNAIDSGIYSGQNQNVIIRNNVSEFNVFGFEVENSINTLVTGNTFRNNSSGGLIYDLAGLSVIKNGINTLVENNIIINNNRDNIAAQLGNGGFVGDAPVGVGLVLAANENLEIRNNTFSGNELLGIAQVTYFIVDENYNPQAPDNAIFSAFNSGISIHDNSFTYGVATPNFQGAAVTSGGGLILATYQTAGKQPFSDRIDYIVESQDYSLVVPGLIGERPYLGQTGQKVIEASFLTADLTTGAGIVITSQSLTDFASGKRGFSSFNPPLISVCK